VRHDQPGPVDDETAVQDQVEVEGASGPYGVSPPPACRLEFQQPRQERLWRQTASADDDGVQVRGLDVRYALGRGVDVRGDADAVEVAVQRQDSPIEVLAAIAEIGTESNGDDRG
jgi:hypothetical protein